MGTKFYKSFSSLKHFFCENLENLSLLNEQGDIWCYCVTDTWEDQFMIHFAVLITKLILEIFNHVSEKVNGNFKNYVTNLNYRKHDS